MEEFRNPNGTYNGVKAMAALSGLSEDEIAWTWRRAKELKAAGLGRAQLAAALKAEARLKPWEKR
jgi:hypothetical protein